MANSKEVWTEIQRVPPGHAGNALDATRKKYLTLIAQKTGRNVIAYYSGWLQKPDAPDTEVNDKDKSGFMLAVNKLPRKKGLDLILHTPGGDVAATESLVDYLYSIFDKDIRVIVPQISMSAGTMIAFCAREIIMGKQSNLGPIDPQMGGIACQAILDEFETAKQDLRQNPASAPLWQVIISKYHPTLLGSCQRAIEWSERMVHNWLLNNMCAGDEDKVNKILKTFGDHKEQKSHARHISKKECETSGLNIISLEDDQNLQDLVLSAHHAFMHSFSHTYAVKIIENHLGNAYIEQSMPLS
ncbi:MAG: S49 family peptidase [Bacteroidia bacterium]|nr:S49 family peptidase [Bacteroidia bacterium]